MSRVRALLVGPSLLVALACAPSGEAVQLRHAAACREKRDAAIDSASTRREAQAALQSLDQKDEDCKAVLP